MQKNEVIIEQFVKAINETPINVTGDPVLLDKIFDGLAKKKRKRKIFSIFLFSSVVLVVAGLVIWGLDQPNKETKEFKAMVGISKHPIPELTKEDVPQVEVKEAKVVPPAKKTKRMSKDAQNTDFSKAVTYKFNNHQVDILKNGGEAVIQINVFGPDGVEQDVLQIMEDLKKSYKNNEVYVDSVKHK